MSYFDKHVFFCTNQRENGEACCANHDAQAMRDYAKARIKKLDKKDTGNIRVNSAGCLDRCGEGPVLVIYPEAVWYTYVDQSDIDEIVDSHLLGGKVVDRLKI